MNPFDYDGKFPRDSRQVFHHRFYEERELGPAIMSYVFGLAMLAVLLALVLISPPVQADSPILVDRKTGKYLGNLNNNSLDANSVSNPLGRYGSPLSPDSINNPLGKYGSRLSNDSPHNPFATNAPAIVSPGDYEYNSDD